MKPSTKAPAAGYTIERLAWTDIPIGALQTPRSPLPLTFGVGSGLSTRASDPPGTVWAIADRGPNLKLELAIEQYGLTALEPLQDIKGAKVMPRPDVGPTIFQLRIDGDVVRLVQAIPLCDASGRPISGLPIPANGGRMEQVFDVRGEPLGIDPSGADTEAIVALSDGSFWIGEEYGPSLLKVGADGRVIRRWATKKAAKAMSDARYPVEGVLPKIAARRRYNRGFEALAISPDERWLYAAFQSALAHPDKGAHTSGRHVRIWRIDAATGDVAAQFLYPFDPPKSFARDSARGKPARSNLKLCDAAALDGDALLVLERVSHSAKIYRVTLTDAEAPDHHLKAKTRPTLEEMDATALDKEGIGVLDKQLLLSTDDAPEIGPDLEGMALLSPRELLLVNDNDFGVEGAETSFWRVRFDRPLLTFGD